MNVNSCKLYEEEGKFLLININTGKLMSIPENIYLTISRLQQGDELGQILNQYDPDEQEQIKGALSRLKGLNFIDCKRRDFTGEAEKYFSTLHFSKTSISEANFFIAQHCNFDCIYCYGGKSGSFGRSDHQVMSEETARQGIRFLVQNHGAFRVQKAAFFGGEPLLNFSVIPAVFDEWEKIKPQYQFLKLYFTITTNGALLTREIVRFMKEKQMGVTISLDGPEEVQNHNRPLVGGKGSFEAVMAGIELLRSENVKFAIRSTLTSQSNVKEIRNFFNENHFDTVLMDIVDYPAMKKEKEYQLDLDDYKRMTDEQNDIYQESISHIKMKKIDSFETQHLSQMYKKMEASPDYWPLKCGAGWSLLSFDVDGDIYPCQRSVGHAPFYLGNVFTGRDKRKIRDIYLNFIQASRSCNECWYMASCKGHCLLNRSRQDGTFKVYEKEVCQAYRDAAVKQTMNIPDLVEQAASHPEQVVEVVTRYSADRAEKDHQQHYAAMESKNG